MAAKLGKIEALRKIVKEGQHARVEGFGVDLFSAGAILCVYDNLNDVNKAKYIAHSIPRMAQIAFKLVKVG